MSEFTAPSGKKVIINMASFMEAMELKNAIERVAAAHGDILKNLTADTDLSAFLPAVMGIDSNPDVFKNLFNCLLRCTHDGEKITAATFEPPAARGDYYPVLIACAKENLIPFFGPLLSQLARLMVLPVIENIVAQKST